MALVSMSIVPSRGQHRARRTPFPSTVGRLAEPTRHAIKPKRSGQLAWRGPAREPVTSQLSKVLWTIKGARSSADHRGYYVRLTVGLQDAGEDHVIALLTL